MKPLKRTFLLQRLPLECDLKTECHIKTVFSNKVILHLVSTNAGNFYLIENVFNHNKTDISLEEYDKIYKDISEKKFLYKKQIHYGDWIFNIISNPHQPTFYHMQLIIAEHEITDIDNIETLPDFIVNNLITEVTIIKEFDESSLATLNNN